MFLPNDVIQYANPVRTIRILWIAPDRTLAFTFELGLQHSQPRTVALNVLGFSKFLSNTYTSGSNGPPDAGVSRLP